MKKIILIFLAAVAVFLAVAYYFNSNQQEEVIYDNQYVEKGDELLKEKKYSKAVEQYKLAINANPSNTNAYVKASDIYLLKSQTDAAISILKNGKDSASYPSEIYYRIGKILFENDQREEALEFIKTSHKKNPDNVNNTVLLAKLYLYFPDKKEEAKKILTDLHTKNLTDKSKRNYYLALLYKDNLDSAKSLLNEVRNVEDSQLKQSIEKLLNVTDEIEEEENTTLIDALWAYEMLQAELYPSVVELLQSSIEKNDEYYASFMYMGVAYMNMQQFEKAKTNLQEANRLNDTVIEPLAFLANVYVVQNDQKAAVETFEEALNIDKNAHKIRYDFAQSLEDFKLYRQARLEYIELIKKDATNKNKYIPRIAQIDLEYLDKPQEALESIKSSIEESSFNLLTSPEQSEFLDLLGWAYFQNDENDKALKYLQQAKEIYPYLPQNYYHLGELNAQLDNFIEAQELYERAIDLDLNGRISAKAATSLELLNDENTQ